MYPPPQPCMSTRSSFRASSGTSTALTSGGELLAQGQGRECLPKVSWLVDFPSNAGSLLIPFFLLSLAEWSWESSWLRKLNLSLMGAAQWLLMILPPMGWSTSSSRSARPEANKLVPSSSPCCDWSFLSACPESALHGPAQSTLWFWAWTTSPLGEAGLELQPLPSQCPHPLCSTVGWSVSVQLIFLIYVYCSCTRKKNKDVTEEVMGLASLSWDGLSAEVKVPGRKSGCLDWGLTVIGEQIHTGRWSLEKRVGAAEHCPCLKGSLASAAGSLLCLLTLLTSVALEGLHPSISWTVFKTTVRFCLFWVDSWPRSRVTANSWPGAQVILSFYKVDIEKKGILNKLLFYLLFKVLLFKIK